MLEVTGLNVVLHGKQQGRRTQVADRPLVKDVSFKIGTSEAFALVGETGAGKSLTAWSLTRLISSQFGVTGDVRLDGRELLSLGERRFADLRGRDIFLIPQTASTSLNPTMKISRQLREVLRDERLVSRQGQAKAREVMVSALSDVGIPRPDYYLGRYPHELSGGMRQRVVLAMALIARPKLLIADEPTSALDVLTQQGVLKALHDLQESHGLTLLFITHDLRAALRVCTRIGVMYSGRLVEQGPITSVLERPRHPYTAALVKAIPTVERRETGIDSRVLDVPHAVTATDVGCPYVSRCDRRLPRCDTEFPEGEAAEAEKIFHCWNPLPPKGP